MRHDLDEEGHKGGRGMAVGGAAQDLPGARIEGGVEGERTMADIFEAVTLRPSGRQGQHRILSVQGLNYMKKLKNQQTISYASPFC